MRVSDALKTFRVRARAARKRSPWLNGVCWLVQETRLSALRSPVEFFDHHRLSRPADMNQATSVRSSFLGYCPYSRSSRALCKAHII